MNHYQIEVSPSTDVTVKYTQKQSSQHLLMSINVCFLSLSTFIALDKPYFFNKYIEIKFDWKTIYVIYAYMNINIYLYRQRYATGQIQFNT